MIFRGHTRLAVPLRAARVMVLGITILFPFDFAGADNGSAPPYRVQNGAVDERTFIGWEVFHLNCHGCHGVDAEGTDIAPNLVEKIKHLTARDFAIKVSSRYRIVVGGGEVYGDDQTAMRQAMLEEVIKYEREKKGELVMPAWEGNRDVKPHIMDLYAYLRARADGVLGKGKPRKGAVD